MKFRIIHRYLGFFLAGIMAIYALSGIVMIFRTTDFLKQEAIMERPLPVDTDLTKIGQQLRMPNLKIEKEANDTVYFNNDVKFSKNTGVVTFKIKKLPTVLEKLTHLHKATTNDPLFFLNIFFGVSLLFFVVSAFYMFLPSTAIFKKGIYFTIAGIVLALVMLFV
ncbi:hypothetical protein KO566_12365 [Flavobacteriaceae bacterium XHP0103]|uniref:hypothetical protein n=1 Tax=Marixanthotalea marina TaxID=2844359 RepID=UPI002989E1FA|nr:hypothetical protein [Marixanthotalea marina]MBU3822858.1 hypothetical protein [Marixanthotalea marina]